MPTLLADHAPGRFCLQRILTPFAARSPAPLFPPFKRARTLAESPQPIRDKSATLAVSARSVEPDDFNLRSAPKGRLSGNASAHRRSPAIVGRRAISALPCARGDSFREFLPRVTVDYQATPDNLLYAVYSEGQKPGGFNGAAAISVRTRDLRGRGCEVLLKSARRTPFSTAPLLVNLALFHNQIEGYQLTQPVEVINPPAAPPAA